MSEAVTHPAYVYDLLGEPRPFAEIDALQLELSAARSQWAIPDTIILCEHPPTLTLGRASDAGAELIGGEDAYTRARLGGAAGRPRRPLDLARPGPARLLPDPRPARPRQGPAAVRARPRARR